VGQQSKREWRACPPPRFTNDLAGISMLDAQMNPDEAMNENLRQDYCVSPYLIMHTVLCL